MGGSSGLLALAATAALDDCVGRLLFLLCRTDNALAISATLMFSRDPRSMLGAIDLESTAGVLLCDSGSCFMLFNTSDKDRPSPSSSLEYH